MTKEEEILLKYAEPICTCGGYPECICDMTKPNENLFYKKNILKAMREFAQEQSQNLKQPVCSPSGFKTGGC